MPLFGGSDESRERTAADREAARLERERRRAQREGREPPASLPAGDEPLPPPDEPRWEPFADEPDPEFRAAAGEPKPLPDDDTEPEAFDGDPDLDDSAPEAAATEPDPDRSAPEAAIDPDPDRSAPEPDRSGPDHSAPEAAATDSEPDRSAPAPTDEHGASEPPPDDPQPTQPLEPVGAIQARRTVSLPRPQTDEDGQHTDSWDRPIGTVRVSRAEYQAQPGAPGVPPHRNLGVRKAPRRWARRLLALLALLLVAAIAVAAFMTYQPFHGKGYGAVVVKIPPGASAKDIGDLLADNDVVDSGFFFALRARLAGDRGKLRAGTYTLKKSMPYKDALAALTQAPTAAPTIDVTLPPGPSRRELAPRVKAAGVRGDYVKASVRSKLLNPRTYGAPKGTRSLEGFLFPDTYELRSRTATARALVALQLRNFKRQFAQVDLKRARRNHLSRYDVLIIASMIEREAMVAKDRRLISAVIYNRLRKGIPLGVDATLRYRLNNWTKPLKESELQINSDYNTRKIQGLPPTPIGNPGLSSIKAAADPANVKYLFYVVKPCGNGAHAFSSTDAQFEKDVAAYNAARKKRGGKDPSHC
ncbi:MAG TPA: endolytic transglycosylase MltG [Solirubrobacteraceae bacterium]